MLADVSIQPPSLKCPQNSLPRRAANRCGVCMIKAATVKRGLFMTDFYVSLIPTNVDWQPTTNAATEAEAYLRRVLPDSDGSQEIFVEFYDRITAVDAGRTFSGSAARSWSPSTVSLHSRPNTLPRCPYRLAKPGAGQSSINHLDHPFSCAWRPSLVDCPRAGCRTSPVPGRLGPSSPLPRICHLYQGWLGMLLTPVLGLAMARLSCPPAACDSRSCCTCSSTYGRW